MNKNKEQRSNPMGRPPKPMPEKIPDTPEGIMRAIVNTKPKKREEWEYLKKRSKGN